MNKLERKFGKFAIRNLMLYFSILYALGFFLNITNPSFYIEYLALDISAILNGEVWRIITWLIYPTSSSPIWGLLMIYMYYSLGTTLERVWGTFKFNVFMFMGTFFHIVAAFVLYFVFKVDSREWYITPDNLNMSIFLMFALTFPEMQFYMFFAIPIKAKVLAIIYIVLGALQFINGGPAEKVTLFLSAFNFIIFYLSSRNWTRISPSEIKRKRDFSKNVKVRPNSSIHKCAVCGRTEKDSPDLEFRYCSKCNGDYEYCSEHLFTHKHVE